MNFRETGLAAMLVLLYACAPEPPPPPTPVTATELRLRDSLEMLRADYGSLRLWEALDRGRRLRVAMEVVPDSVGAEVRVEVYQYLGMLHFEHERWLDSIGYYAAAADNLLATEMPPVYHARQALCWAYVSYHDWAMREMEMYTDYGLRKVNEETPEHAHLRGLLLIARGKALKQLGDRRKDRKEQRKYYNESELAFQKALACFEKNVLTRSQTAMEELGILLTRLPERQEEVVAVANQLEEIAVTDAAAAPVANRLRAYYHWKRGNLDSALHYYHRLYSLNGLFAEGYPLEAMYYIREFSRQTGRFQDALKMSKIIQEYYGCCPDNLDGRSNCSDKTVCVFVMAQHAEIFRHRYGKKGDLEDLRMAYNYIMRAIDGYPAALRRISSEGTYNQTVLHGDDIITSAIRTVYAILTTSVLNEDKALEAAFQIIEFGKAHSLALELSQLARHRADAGNQTVFAEWKNAQKTVDSLKTKPEQGENLSDRDLDKYTSAMRKRRYYGKALDRAFGMEQQDGAAAFGKAVALSDVRVQLTEQEALVELLETEDAVYGLYVDRDTSLAYTIDSTVRSEALDFQTLVHDPSSNLTDLKYLGAEVYARIFGPVAGLLAKKQELVFSPSASLSSLPVAALTVDTSYFMERYAVRYIDSWRTERIQAARRKQLAGGALLKAGIWTHPQLTHYLGPLGDKLLANYSTTGHHYTGTMANTGTFRTKAAAYDLIHLSVHARGNPRRLHDNYLYLSDQDSINGLQIGNLNLSCRLVVLAACSTARGVTARREGTYSLRRSFHLAGVPDVVSSLYDVPAVATDRLLSAYYQRAAEIEFTAKALRYAQRSVAQTSSGRWQHPFYWSAMILA